MSLVEFPRCQLTLLRLEDRCTPATFTVTTTKWAAMTVGSLPWAIASANDTDNNLGQDTIEFNWTVLGNTPTFSVPLNGSLEIQEGVVINAGMGAIYATFTDFRPFHFRHLEGTSKESVLNGGVFDKCVVPANATWLDGGAILLDNEKLTVKNSRFT
jgi:hypothetical protein